MRAQVMGAKQEGIIKYRVLGMRLWLVEGTGRRTWAVGNDGHEGSTGRGF
jgi:hypothetical protein